MLPFSWLPAKRNFPGACTAKPSSHGARQSGISLASSNKENLFTSVQREHSNSSSGFVLFTLGMKWAPNTGTLVECYGDVVSREGHFSEDFEGRATPRCYQVTRVWFCNLIRGFEIPVVLGHKLCVHSACCAWGVSHLRLKKRGCKNWLTQSRSHAGGWNYTKSSVLNSLETKGLCGSCRQCRNSKGKVVPAPRASFMWPTKSKILLSCHSCGEMRKSLLYQLPWWEMCHCFLLWGGEGHCSVGNVWAAGPCTFGLQVSEATAT